MFTRSLLGNTLDDVLNGLESPPGETIRVDQSAIKFDLIGKGEPSITLKPKVVIPANLETLSTLSSWGEMPTKWLLRQNPRLQQHVFTSVFRTQQGEVLVRYDDEHLYDVRDPHRRGMIDPRDLVQIAQRAIAPKAQVIESWVTPEEFRLDTVVPENAKFGIGGVKPTTRQRGDLCLGGLRIGHNRKRNLAPWAQPYFYRLVCTNGMEVPDTGMRVEGRGQSVEDVLMELELAAQRAMGMAEERIKHFYDLRNQQVKGDVTAAVRRIGHEHNLPERIVGKLEDLVPAIEADPVTMFDVVNLFTNLANEPSIRRKDASARGLEMAGGTVVTEHVERCARCQSKLLA